MTDPAPVEAAGGILHERGTVLMVLDRRGRWGLPKGHVEAGEPPRRAAEREVREETGLVVEALDLVGEVRYPLPEGRVKRVCFYRLARRGGTLAPQLDELGGVAIVAVDAARALLERHGYPNLLGVLEAAVDPGRVEEHG